jgi:F-type H+-transporting ATPase subunit b
MSATPLDPAEQERAMQLIGEAFGAPVDIAFNTDPGLIAGLEIRTDHLVVSNSWRADLTHILAELAHDK